MVFFWPTITTTTSPRVACMQLRILSAIQGQLPVHSLSCRGSRIRVLGFVDSLLLLRGGFFHQFHRVGDSSLLPGQIYSHIRTINSLQNLHEVESNRKLAIRYLCSRYHQRIGSFGLDSIHRRNTLKQKFSLNCQKYSADNGLYHHYSSGWTHANSYQMFHGIKN